MYYDTIIYFRYHYLVLSFMQDEETEIELELTDEELKVRDEDRAGAYRRVTKGRRRRSSLSLQTRN